MKKNTIYFNDFSINFKHITIELLDALLLILTNQVAWSLAMHNTGNDHLRAFNLFDWIDIVTSHSVKQRLVKAMSVKNHNMKLNIFKCKSTLEILKKKS